jgi:O-antigen/teichoic acid export membrane protein
VVLLLVGVAHSSLLVEPMLVLGPSRYSERFKEYFSILLRFQWAFGAVATATLLLVGATEYALGEPLLGKTFIGLACAAPFIFLSWLVRRACYLERKPAVAALGGAVNLFIAGLGAVLIYYLGLLTSMAAQLLMGVAACAAAAVIVRTIAPSGERLVPTIDMRLLWRDHWNFFRWSGASGLLYFAQGQVFYLALPFFSGLEATAALRAMTNFVMPLLQSDGALVTLIAPEMARARRDPYRLSRIVDWAKRLFALEGLICWLIVAVFRHDLVRFAYGDRYVAYADLLVVLGALPLVVSRVNILGALLRVHRQVRPVFWAAAAAAAASLAVGLTSLPTLGVYGAVSAMIVADVVRIAVMTHFLGKPIDIAHDAEGEPHILAPSPSPPVLEVRR